MNKQRLYSIAYLICLILLINSLPFSMFIDNEIVLFIINLVIKILSIIYICRYIKKEELNTLKLDSQNISSLKLLPLILLCGSNFMVVLFQNPTLNKDIDLFKIVTGLVISLGISIVEELLFRSQVLEEFLHKKSKIQSLIYSSLIFGAVHLLNISSFGSIPNILVQVGYTFFLGLVVGVIYLTSKNIILPIIYHFLFNFINDILVVELYKIKWDLTFFIVNIVLGIFVLIYILFLLKINKQGDDLDASENMDN